MERGKTKKGLREVMLTFVDVQYGLISHFKHSTAFHWIERNFLHCHSWSLHLPRPYESKHNMCVCMLPWQWRQLQPKKL